MKRIPIMLLICLLLFGTAFGCKNRTQESAAETAAQPQKTETPTAEPTPEPEITTGKHVSGALNLTDGKNIYLQTGFAAWHELTHMLLAEFRYEPASAWICEGIAEHFGVRAGMIADPYGAEELPWSEGQELSDEERYFFGWMKVFYDAVSKEDPDTREGCVNSISYRNAVALCFQLLPEDKTADMQYRSTVGGARKQSIRDKESDGSALLYEEALVMLDYLFDTYGAETVMDGYMHGVSLKEMTGKSYAEMYGDFTAYLKETYGDLLRDETE